MLKNKNQDSWSGNMELTSILYRAWQAVGAFLQRNTYLILQHLPCSTDKIPGILRKIGTSSVCNSQCAENAIFTNGKAGWFYREVHISDIGFWSEAHTKSLHAELDTGFCVAALDGYVGFDMGSFQSFQ